MIHNPSLKSTNLTKREYFAAMAMQGILANENRLRDYNARELESGAKGTLQGAVARQAVSYADALIKELEKSNE